MAKKTVTPRQAASARTVDRWQREVHRLIVVIVDAYGARPVPALAALSTVWRGLVKLERSIQRTERR